MALGVISWCLFLLSSSCFVLHTQHPAEVFSSGFGTKWIKKSLPYCAFTRLFKLKELIFLPFKCCAKSRSRKTAGVKGTTKQTTKEPASKALGRGDFTDIHFKNGTSTQEQSCDRSKRIYIDLPQKRFRVPTHGRLTAVHEIRQQKTGIKEDGFPAYFLQILKKKKNKTT